MALLVQVGSRRYGIQRGVKLTSGQHRQIAALAAVEDDLTVTGRILQQNADGGGGNGKDAAQRLQKLAAKRERQAKRIEKIRAQLKDVLA